MVGFRSILLALCSSVALLASAPAQEAVSIDAPGIALRGIPFDVAVSGGQSGDRLQLADQVFEVRAVDDGWRAEGVVVGENGVATLALQRDGRELARGDVRVIPAWLSVLPPLLSILVALLFRKVIPALFVGLWVGAWIALGSGGVAQGLLDAFQVYVRGAFGDLDRVSIILFTFMIGGMVGIISRNGGTQGVVDLLVRRANTPRRGQLVTAGLGLAVFFDDYANTLVVGNTMRPVTDRLRISREKLAYLVDSTAAPVACLAFVTTWIGYEVGIVGSAVEKIDGFDEAAYSIFLHSIPYSFYPLLSIFFVFAVAWTGRDFGPMYAAERAAHEGGASAGVQGRRPGAEDAGELAAKSGIPARAWNAVIPVLVLVGGVLVGLFATGEGDDLRAIIGSADSYAALMWASLCAVLVAAVLSMAQGLLDLEEVVDAWYCGVRAMLLAMIILVLAWALSDITGVLHTADFLVSALGDAIPMGLLPALVFVISAATAFATGSSWGTMGILMPLIVPLAWAVLQGNGAADPEHYYVLYSAVACVLSGAVWGDHCSPISDTTILSSMASGCDHVAHVRTQLGYAVSVGAVAVLLGTVPTGFGLPWWLSLLVGAAVLGAILRVFGRPVRA